MFNVNRVFPAFTVGCVIFIFSLQSVCYSQSTKGLSLPKKILDIEDIKSWPKLGLSSKISKDGAYFMYEIMNQPVGNSTLVIQSTKGTWEKRILGLDFSKVYFSGDSKQLIYQLKDSLFLLKLGSSSYDKIIPNVDRFSFPSSGDGKWFIYQNKKTKDQAVIYYLITAKEVLLPNYKSCWFDDNGTSLIVKTELNKGNAIVRSLKHFDINKESMTTIWSDTLDCDHINLSKDGLEVAFTVYNSSLKNNEVKQMDKAIWHFKQGMKAANPKVNSDISKDLIVSGRPSFVQNSNWLIFDFQTKPPLVQPEKDAVKLKIWSYKDKIILPNQIQKSDENGGKRTYKAAINVVTDQIIQIENDSDFLSYGPVGDYVIIKGQNYVDEIWWKMDKPHPTILLSLKDNKRIILKNDNNSLINFSFSPDGNWLIYYDKTNLYFFSYNLKTGAVLNITKSIPTSFQKQSDDGIERASFPVFGVVAWIAEDNSLVLNDYYDIWRVDPSGARKAINITNGYGKKNRIKLRLVYSNEVQFGFRKNIISLSDTVLISGFSSQNKYNGFYKKTLGEVGDPQKLYMGPYTFYRTESQKPHYFSLSDGMRPQKADSANIWVVTRETASEPKNYFVTEDFKNFRPLSNLYPEKEYNWLTTQLITWKQFDGTMSQGVLYKPENFDSTKKYPLLITYYDKMSHRLYEFPNPDFTTGDLNIPWFVTHGYLVFTPDIHYTIANITGVTTGESAYNSVVSAAQYLSKFSYVDKAKMGIEGHSFGGGQTNFIITHSNLFAAACEFAGYTDAISSYLTLVPFGASFENFTKQVVLEFGQGRMGASLWERPDLYLKQSPVLQANKITSPLLIAHNENDNNINWRQGLELYMALRRLGKKVWMLQYEDGHSLLEEKNAIDFTIRLTQFFDHYLKNQFPPEWMVKGIPPNLIGQENGYKLEKSQNERH